jgi:hypothetical protein
MQLVKGTIGQKAQGAGRIPTRVKILCEDPQGGAGATAMHSWNYAASY